MRYLARVALCLAAMLSLSACATASGFPKSTYDVSAEIETVKPYFASDVIIKYHRMSGAAQEEYRSEVVYNRMRACDIYYDAFLREVSTTRTTGTIAADSAVVLLNAIGSQIKPASTASILAAMSGGVVGIKGSVDKEMFYNATLPALISQMESGRATARAVITTGLAQPTNQYSLEAGLLDVRHYCMAGSIPGALANVTKNAGTAQDEAEKEIKGTVRSVTYRDNAPNVDKIKTSIDGLTDDQRLALQKSMWPKLNQRAADTKARVTSCQPVDDSSPPATVQAALRCYATRDDRSMSSIAQWNDALRDVKP